MKTKFNANLKDNVAAATLLTATFLAIMAASSVAATQTPTKSCRNLRLHRWKCNIWKPSCVNARRIK